MLLLCNARYKVCAHHIYALVFGAIVLYGLFLKGRSGSDALETKFAACQGCDFWALTHFALYLVLGYLFPKHLGVLFLIGIGYELFEAFLGASMNIGKESWWYGRISDIVFNTLGMLIGAIFEGW